MFLEGFKEEMLTASREILVVVVAILQPKSHAQGHFLPVLAGNNAKQNMQGILNNSYPMGKKAAEVEKIA